ncbi:MAG: DUF2934 domain-containing protein [Candidatus Manganitrophus sp.]|nr:DUF2934 domain-containing protein [Candidatus Manganitrophus sp.]
MTQKETNGRMDERSMQERIAERAYELYQKRGQYHGNDLADWLEAEQSVLSEHNPTAAPSAAAAKPASRAKSPRKRSNEQKAS